MGLERCCCDDRKNERKARKALRNPRWGLFPLSKQTLLTTGNRNDHQTYTSGRPYGPANPPYNAPTIAAAFLVSTTRRQRPPDQTRFCTKQHFTQRSSSGRQQPPSRPPYLTKKYFTHSTQPRWAVRLDSEDLTISGHRKGQQINQSRK